MQVLLEGQQLKTKKQIYIYNEDHSKISKLSIFYNLLHRNNFDYSLNSMTEEQNHNFNL